MDRDWWDTYIQEVREIFVGERFSTNKLPESYQVTYLNKQYFNAYSNSGAGAVSLALAGAAKKVVLLGYDCQKTEGKAHWHGNHPKHLANAKQIDKWPALFQKLRDDYPEAEIINSTRITALDMFPKVPLENAL
jgi:hypothetical protein